TLPRDPKPATRGRFYGRRYKMSVRLSWGAAYYARACLPHTREDEKEENLRRLVLRVSSHWHHFDRLRTSVACWIHLGRRIAFDAEPVYRRTGRIEGYLDEHPGGLLSAGAHFLLDFAQVRRIKSVAIPHSQRAPACGLGGFALAHPEASRLSRGVVGSRALGIASDNGAVGRLGDGVKKYSVVPVLSLIDLLVFGSGRGGNRRPAALVVL